MGRYSNPLHTPSDLRKLTEMTPDGTLREATGEAPKQRQHRLRERELEHPVADYRSGVAANELATRYDINRDTVLEHMRRQDVPRRYPRLGEADVREAIRLYELGESLAKIGDRMNVNAGTVGRALHEAGVVLRDCHGQQR